jgi:hypothetical protein
VVKALFYKPEGRGFDTQSGEFLNYLILPAALGPGVYSTFNRNEYQKHKRGVKRGGFVGLTTLPPSVSRLSKSFQPHNDPGVDSDSNRNE